MFIIWNGETPFLCFCFSSFLLFFFSFYPISYSKKWVVATATLLLKWNELKWWTLLAISTPFFAIAALCQSLSPPSSEEMDIVVRRRRGVTHWMLVVMLSTCTWWKGERSQWLFIVLVHVMPPDSWSCHLLLLCCRHDLSDFSDIEDLPGISSYSLFHLVGNLIILIDPLRQDKVVLVSLY